ncbi:hypothetical protein NKG99_07090 [Mesorhizobium sp. M1409]|uniref:hypothetical protein n=1 Tax=unclassified Mesorhizobium TaxID=325217 RepID=UPI0033377DE1
MRPFMIFASALIAAGALLAGLHIGSGFKETSREILPRPTMELANPERITAMELLLQQAKEMPASRYSELPEETTLTESMLMQVLAYLQSVRPTGGGDGTTGAPHMKALIQDAAQQYDAYLSRRVSMLESKATPGSARG